MTPRVLVLADVPTWAWGRKADAYKTHLSHDFDVTVAYHSAVPRFDDFDLIHLFEVSQVGTLSGYPPIGQRGFKAVAGLTAHVWRTWGADRMRKWAAHVEGLHGNSLLIAKELVEFHPRVFYTPNGVDPDRFIRTRHRTGKIVFGHVGKPNPRKGADIIAAASLQAGVELRLIQRTSKLALSQADMLAWYQGIDVMVTASNMDGTPNPMLEGAACECALLSTPIGNMPEFITPRNGILTMSRLPYHPPDDPRPYQDVALNHYMQRETLREELAAHMRALANDPEATRAMGQLARETVLKAWTWQHQVESVGRMWAEVLG